MRRLFHAFATVAAAAVLVTLAAAGIAAAASSGSGTTVKTIKPAPDARPNPAQLAEGKVLFDQSCSSCHGVNAAGSSLAPSLLGRGAATVDLWVSSGWMPLTVPRGSQPTRKPNKFTPSQTIAIANYVASLKPGGFAIPTGNTKGANAALGQELFAENCAGCHTITGSGDALSGGLVAPSLHGLTARQITEAVITAPGNMPHFYPGALTETQVRDVVAYVNRYIGHPVNQGGVGLGGNGPVAEGFIGLFLGVGGCLLFALWVGDRSEKEEHDQEAVTNAHV